ncbi:DUF4440 domain-containing protein [Taklimakanibacter lacteus]|uniref:DUF4440 domain-containing protein n=1 Tax=Taklimakanibacter lacteus TaxID=2268456 RepID=UPI000E663A36
MAPYDFDTFLARREEAAEAYVTGDGKPVDRIVPHEGEASFHAPTGDSVVGAAEVARRHAEDAKAFVPSGTSAFEVLQRASDEELAFWAGYQLAEAQIGDMPAPQSMRIRVTEIFRKINGDWKMIQRHADMTKPKGS